MDQAAAQFQRSLVLKRQSDLSSLHSDMEMLRKFDQDSEAKQSKWTKLAIASVLVALHGLAPQAPLQGRREAAPRRALPRRLGSRSLLTRCYQLTLVRCCRARS